MRSDIDSRWRALLQELRPEMPPPNMGLYVKPGHSCADEIVRDFQADPSACSKFLLVGARGGGKSTELRAIGAGLRGKAALIEIDLDKSGVTAATVSAYDLLYISSLALLRGLPEAKATPLFEELATRYAGEDQKAKQGLGDLKTALAGIAMFATTASTAAVALGLTPGGAPIIGAAAAAASQGLRLLEAPSGVVAETSPRGRGLQEAAAKISREVRSAQNLPLCILIDGLEKMNGEAGERFRQVFEQTRLLADARWAAVIAAPPSTMSETSSVDGRGYSTKPVWGFGPDGLDGLCEMLKRRFIDSGFNPDKDVSKGGLEEIAEKSGGLPRHAIMMLREAVIRAQSANSPTLNADYISEGIRKVAESLGRGLTSEHLQVLSSVLKTKRLPRTEKASTLFADGRILAYPPSAGSILIHFVVHPLLVNDVIHDISVD